MFVVMVLIGVYIVIFVLLLNVNLIFGCFRIWYVNFLLLEVLNLILVVLLILICIILLLLINGGLFFMIKNNFIRIYIMMFVL